MLRRPNLGATFSGLKISPIYVCAAVVIALALIGALTAPWLVPFDPLEQDLLSRNQGPGSIYLLGTDHFGRDVLSRLIVGIRLSLFVGVGGAVIALFAGAVVGLAAVAIGGAVEYIVFAFVDLVRSLPGVLLALLLVVTLGAGIIPLVFALGLTFAPQFARVSRAVYQREAGADYVAVARSFGSGKLRVLKKHIMPNILGTLITQWAIVLPRCIVTESVLSFLGLGVEPDTPTWGQMIAQASRYFEINPTAVLAPIAALSVITLSLALISDRLRIFSDPLRCTGGAS